MAKTPPHLHLFFVRCTMLAFHALMWSFLYQSKLEYEPESLKVMSEETFEMHLDGVVITGSLFLAVLAILTFVGISIRSLSMHYFMIIFHAIGILLVIISVLEYWEIRYLWIPTILCCVLPAVIEALFDVVKLTKSH